MGPHPCQMITCSRGKWPCTLVFEPNSSSLDANRAGGSLTAGMASSGNVVVWLSWGLIGRSTISDQITGNEERINVNKEVIFMCNGRWDLYSRWNEAIAVVSDLNPQFHKISKV